MGFEILDCGFVINFVDEIAGRFGTRDVFLIARRAGVSVVYESWHPVTFGEFERKTRIIRVNRRALDEAKDSGALERKIIAHEIAHFFALEWGLDRDEEEKFARSFAETLTKND